MIANQSSAAPKAIASIKAPSQQPKRAERNAANLIHTAGLASKVMTGETFHLRVENGSLNDLVIESHQVGNGERLLYLSQYLERRSREGNGLRGKSLPSHKMESYV